VFTSPILLPLVAHILEEIGALDKLEQFVSTNGRKFYGFEQYDVSSPSVIEKVAGECEVSSVYSMEDLNVVPFLAGKRIGWRLKV
jgi:dihydroorotase